LNNSRELGSFRTATPSPIIGFTFDRTPVETELAQLAGTMDAVMQPLFKGTVDDVDAAISAAQETLRAGGGDTIRAELEKQLAAWKAA
jgi:putative aldouronate transport system substrate-binding protein